MRQSSLTAAGMLGFLALAAPAMAQESYLPKGLSRVDLKMVQEAAGNLAPEGPREGSWSNPKNGHSGTVTYVKSTKEKGMNCRLFPLHFRHRDTPPTARRITSTGAGRPRATGPS